MYGADPFAPNFALPPVPFYLGLYIYNGGYGTAYAMSITSSQPKIVDNQKGLLISFSLIGAQVGNQSVSPSLTVSLGNLVPFSTICVRWVMTSTLTGDFISYSASYQNSNPIGRADVSLIDNVTIYEMIEPVRIDWPSDDYIPDFLTNEDPDPQSLPDHVHSSTGNAVYLVYAVLNVTEVANTSSAAGTIIQVRLNPIVTIPNDSYIYGRMPDFLIGVPLTSVVRITDGKPLLPENVWRTARDILVEGQPPVYENYIHLFDGGNVTDWVYNLTFNGLLPPQNFHVVSISLTTISLAWNHSNPNVTTYKLQMRNYNVVNSSWNVLDNFLQGTMFTVTNLNQSTNYEFQVFASLNGAFEYNGATLVVATFNPATSSTGTTGFVHTTGSLPTPPTPKPTTRKPTQPTAAAIQQQPTSFSPLWIVFIVVFVVLILGIIGVIVVVYLVKRRKHTKLDLDNIDLSDFNANKLVETAQTNTTHPSTSTSTTTSTSGPSTNSAQPSTNTSTTASEPSTNPNPTLAAPEQKDTTSN